MRAVIYDSFRSAPVVRDVPDPTRPPAGVVIAVAATGVCRSDWHGWMGHDPDIALPHVPGHEFAGIVVEVGPDVGSWTVGQRVCVPFVCACGVCPPCRAGDQQVCDDQFQPGFTHWGTFAELVAIDRADVNLVELPDGLDFVTAAGLGCRFSTSYRAVVAHGGVRPGDWVSVLGCGGVGLAAVMIAAARGARVVAIDVSPAALALARSIGAEVSVDAREPDVPARVRELTGGGTHISIDALGRASTCADSVRCLRKRGRHVQIGLMLADDALAPMPMGEVIARELELVGSHGMAAHEFAPMLDEIVRGTLRPQLLIGRTISLDEAPAALTAMRGPGTTVVTLPGWDDPAWSGSTGGGRT